MRNTEDRNSSISSNSSSSSASSSTSRSSAGSDLESEDKGNECFLDNGSRTELHACRANDFTPLAYKIKIT